MGITHLQALAAVDRAVPIAVPRREESRARLAKAGYQTAADLDEAVRLGAGRCIVATDTSRHVIDSMAALELGLDVLVEKPIAPDAPTASDLNKRAADLGLNLFVGCVLRFSASLVSFFEKFNQVGRLHSVRIESQSYLPDWRPDRAYQEAYSARSDEGGVLRDLIHEIDYAGWLFGWPASLQATVRNLGRLEISSDEAADLNWETPDGCVISLRLDYLSKPTRRGIMARGERGTIEWDGVAQTVSLSLEGQPLQEFQFNQTKCELFLAQDLAFTNSARYSADPRLATGDDGVKALAVCDTARMASESRREELVTYP
jgi:predicted dehydrogenase